MDRTYLARLAVFFGGVFLVGLVFALRERRLRRRRRIALAVGRSLADNAVLLARLAKVGRRMCRACEDRETAMAVACAEREAAGGERYRCTCPTVRCRHVGEGT